MGTPVLSHLVFLALALVLLAALLWRRRPADLAMAAMLGGALVFTASFFVVSLACDYRYLYFLDLSAMTAGLYWVIDFGSLCTKPYKN
jgi:amino acid permease